MANKRVEQATNDVRRLYLGVRNYLIHGEKFMLGLDDEDLKQQIVAEIELRAARQERRIKASVYDQMRQEAWHPENN
jgi:hypothetical protein